MINIDKRPAKLKKASESVRQLRKYVQVGIAVLCIPLSCLMSGHYRVLSIEFWSCMLLAMLVLSYKFIREYDKAVHIYKELRDDLKTNPPDIQGYYLGNTDDLRSDIKKRLNR